VGLPGRGCSLVAVAECSRSSGKGTVMSTGRGGVVRVMINDHREPA
jgi:hypothetical protein